MESVKCLRESKYTEEKPQGSALRQLSTSSIYVQNSFKPIFKQ